MPLALLLTMDDLEALATLRMFAAANWFPADASWIPGDRPEYVRLLSGGFRVVFTFMQSVEGSLYLHASISMRPNGLPPPHAVLTIALALGFSTENGAMDWSVDVQEECIVVAQRIGTKTELGLP